MLAPYTARITALETGANHRYISTTTAPLQAISGGKYQIVEEGNLIFPPDPEDGDFLTVADPSYRLLSQNNQTIATGKTIGKGQLKGGLAPSDRFHLHNTLYVNQFTFIFSEDNDNWGILTQGTQQTLNALAQPYIYTSASLQAYHGALISVEDPGDINLWNASDGEYCTINDGLGLLATIDVFLVAPVGHTIGLGQFPAGFDLTRVNLKNPNGANWIRPIFDGVSNWELTITTKNG
jgi:hypothetical protein